MAGSLSFVKRVLNKAIRVIENAEKDETILKLANIGEGSVLLSGLKLNFSTGKEDREYITIGKKCLIESNFIFETASGYVSIGNNVHIGGATFICRTKIEIHDDVTMAWGITLYDHNSHSIYWEDRKNDNHNCYSDYHQYNGNNIVNKDWSAVVSKPIIIHSKVWIGFGVTVLKGVTIGEGAVVGAGSVVTRNVEPWTVVGGNPAVVIKKLK
ncbi:MAG: acyltransferase [Mucilaginibacter sp.]|uniref:acyltransferase n=1 Tax=Mucilaginibacter sp. TaxID=1882438 RepID=UPI003262F5DF